MRDIQIRDLEALLDGVVDADDRFSTLEDDVDRAIKKAEAFDVLVEKARVLLSRPRRDPPESPFAAPSRAIKGRRRR